VFYVDTTGWLTADLRTDSVHPNDAGHKVIAAKLGPIIEAKLDTATQPPTTAPTSAPTTAPSSAPTTAPTIAPTTAPTTAAPTTAPTTVPATSATPTASSTPASGACAVTYAKTGDWGAGAQFDVTVRNTSGVAVNGWTLSWTLPGSQQITQSWNATTSQSGTAATAVNVGWNAQLPASGSASFGFITDSNLGGATGFALNGTACTATA
jgi:cellulase/cellobiase CelA1